VTNLSGQIRHEPSFEGASVNKLAQAVRLGLVSALALSSASIFAQVDSSSGRVDPGLEEPIASKVNYDPLKSGETFDSFIVYYRDGVGEGRSLDELNASLQAISDVLKVNVSYNRTVATGGVLVDVAGGAAGEAARTVMEAFAAQREVSYIEPNARMTIRLTPNDTRYSEQWHYFDSVAGMNLPAAWDLATGTGVTVAVLDTGYVAHSDLAANIVAGYDFISSATAARDGNGRDSNPADQGDWFTGSECGVSFSQNSSWHGTHVAGTIAAVSNNAKGVAGVAFNAKIQPVRVLGRCGGSLADIADAIIWASGGTVSGVPANATPSKVINMSLGGGGSCGTTYQNAINSAVGRGTVVVVAAGNENQNASNSRPANCTNVIAVAALDKEGNRANYSNFGAVVDIAAPGGETATISKGVLSTLNTGTTTPGSESYAFYQGTSMATPHVAGLAALMLSKKAMTPAEVETSLKANVRAFTGSCSQCGAGMADALKTIQSVTGGGGGGGGGTSTFTNTNNYTISDNTTVESPITISGQSGNASATTRVVVKIVHSYRGDLVIDLVAPDNTTTRLKNSSGSDSAANVNATYTVNVSTKAKNGTWKLRVRDVYTGDTGYIDEWSITP
jgi:serine protease